MQKGKIVLGFSETFSLSSDKVVAVFWLGTIGLLTIQWLKIAGVKTIIGIDIQSEKLKQALDLGVTDTIDPSVQDLEKRFLG